MSWNPLRYVTTLRNLVITYLKSYKKLRVEGPYSESLSCHVSRSLFQCKCIYKVFKMSRDLTKPRDWRMKELYEWKFSMLYHQLAKCSVHRYCSSRNIMFLVFYIIKQGRVLKGQVTIMIGVPLGKSRPC